MCTALVVDASPIGRMTTNNALVVLDYDVREARDGASALHQCKVRMPELVVLDWGLPNAMACLGSIRALPGGLQPTVLVCAVDEDPGQMMLAVAAGADEYVLKPVRREDLEQKLARLAAWELDRELAA